MEYKFILYEKFDKIAKITLNRPEVMNALSRQVFEEMIDAFPKAEEDDEVRVVILAGAGDNFSSGHDLGSKEELEDRKKLPWPTDPWQTLKRTDRHMWDFTLSLRNLSKPTIAMVQGYCIMGGWKLASACDLIMASEDAKFADRAVRWGSAHIQFSTLFWDLGPRKAKEHLWTGDFIDGKEAFRLGMVNRVVPREHLEKETIKLANRIALNEPMALKLSKASVNLAVDIMGQTAATEASYYIDTLARAYMERNRPEGTKSIRGVESAKERDKRFEEQ